MLCGGVIDSPKLLMLSGIGPADHLKAHGIAVVADVPGVGRHLQDHLEVYIQYASKQPVSIGPWLKHRHKPRIGAEEQARLAAAGYDSVYNHPFRWLMANVTNRDDLATLTGDNLVETAKVMDVITKDAHGRLHDKVASRARIFGVTSIKLDEGGYLANDAYRGWVGELGQISAAPEGAKMAELRDSARAMSAEMRLWFFSGFVKERCVCLARR